MLNLKKGLLAVSQKCNNRNFLLAVTVLMVFTIFCVMIAQTKVVSITEDNQTKILFSMKTDPMDILEAANVKINSGDAVTLHNSNVKSEMNISVSHTFPVTINADGEVKTLMTTGGKVEDILALANVFVEKQDIVSPERDQQIEVDQEIVVTRIEHSTYSQMEYIEVETVVAETDKLQKGVVQVSQEGSRGEVEVFYDETFIDGVSQSRKVLKEVVHKEMQNRIELVGTKEVPSQFELPSELLFDENGNPLNYSKVLRNKIATAYSAKPGAKGASGMRLIPGSVAVNPSVIPYGTKLYIKASNGNYIYGTAVAADTGVGLLQGIIDVDVFFGSYGESCQFGRKIVDIYVLD